LGHRLWINDDKCQELGHYTAESFCFARRHPLGHGIYWSPGAPKIHGLRGVSIKCALLLRPFFERLAHGSEPWVVVHRKSNVVEAPPQNHFLELVTQPLLDPIAEISFYGNIETENGKWKQRRR